VFEVLLAFTSWLLIQKIEQVSTTTVRSIKQQHGRQRNPSFSYQQRASQSLKAAVSLMKTFSDEKKKKYQIDVVSVWLRKRFRMAIAAVRQQFFYLETVR
jgi:hypothetical protein